jgi:hypothetical protein
LVAAVNASEVTASHLDDMATGILAAWYKLGQDTDYPKVAVNFQDISGAPQVVVRAITRRLYAILEELLLCC